jgi:T5SS/PEP-CTERM-associated repeat protein
VVGRDAPAPGSYTSGNISVSGVGSSLSAESLTIGAGGYGSLTVSSGGIVTADTVGVGRDAPALGSYSSSSITVDGAGSSLSAASLTIGAAGSGYLTVSNGGEVAVNTFMTIGATGSGSLNVFSGGTVTADTVVVGRDAPAPGSYESSDITVSGTGSSLSTESLTIGAAGNGNLTVSNGGSASWNRLYLAVQAGSQGTATFSGVNLNMDTIDFTGNGTATLRTGWDGYWGAPNGPVTATATAPLVLGGLSGSSGSISVGGTGSTLSTQSLTIGGAGTGSLLVSNGGQVNTGHSSVIGDGGVGYVVVQGAGSKWTIDGFGTHGLTVGAHFGGIGQLQIQNGGNVTVKEGGVAMNSTSLLGTASSVFVTGAGSKLLLDGLFGDLRVGDSNGRAVVMVSNGGYLKSGGGYIGGSLGTNGQVTVTGTNSHWVILSQVGGGTGILGIGNNRFTEGRLDVTQGGTVTVYGQTTVGLYGGAGNITISGGTLATGPVLGDTGALLVGPTGTLTAGPKGTLQSTLLLGSGTSSIQGTLDLQGANGTPGALHVRFLQPDGHPATGNPALSVNGQVLLTIATSNTGASSSAPNGSSSAILGVGTGNSLLTVTENGTLDLTGANFRLLGLSGLASNWDATKYYSWQVIQIGSGVTVDGVESATIDTTQFGQPINNGTFVLTTDAYGVYLAFSPVPEPATVMMIGAVGLGLWSVVRRRAGKHFEPGC